MENLFGRTKIYSDVVEVDESNLLEVLSAATAIHSTNVSQMNYLWDYYRGKQDILDRKKDVREDILNKIIENHAKEIVDFKTGYLCGCPIVYASRNPDEKVSEQVDKLNDYMLLQGRVHKDKMVVDNQNIFGTAYKLAVASLDPSPRTPFEMYAVDPRKAFVIYSTDIGEKPLAGVYAVVDSKNNFRYTVYTPTKWYKVVQDEIVERGVNGIGQIPLIEYPANAARLGAFEVVLSLQDELNTLASNRIDGVEQFIQSLVILTNCEMPEGETLTSMMKKGLVTLRSRGELKSDVKILSEQLDQSQSQTLKNDIYQSMLTICAMPNRNGGLSTSDTGKAVIYRDGWSAAETAAQNSENIYKASETEFLKVILKICSDLGSLEVDPSVVDIKFTRRNFEGNAEKAQVLIEMLNNNKLDPRLAFIYSGLFADAEEAYQSSIPYIKEALKQAADTDREV